MNTNNNVVQIDYNVMAENLVGYYKFERQTHDRKFCLSLIVETYERIGNQPKLVQAARNKLQKEFA